MTFKEIKLLTEYQIEVFKEVFWTKEDGKVLESKLDKVQTTLDNFAKQTGENQQEIVVLNNRMKSAEDWIDKASPKLRLKLKR